MTYHQMPSARGGARRRNWFWLITIVALLTFAVTFALGRWQLSRAAQKEALQAGIQTQSAQPLIDMRTFLDLKHGAGAMNRTVRLRGLWLGAQTVYLDNRQMHELSGFYVMTPLALEGSDQTILVQRGWVQRNFEERGKLIPIETPTGLVEVSGRIAPPPGRLLELGHAAPIAPGASAASVSGSSMIRQNLDLAKFKAETGLPLRTDVTLQEMGPASGGLQRDWAAPNFGIERNYGYAFQWFGLAALVAILYVWFQLIAPWRRARRAAAV